MTQFTQDMALTQYAEGGGIRFAYRRFGISAYRRFGVPERLPLVFFQHFMGTLDDHDPALSDAFAIDREVILFDNAGVASSSGTVPGTIEAMARDAISFTDALGLNTIDLVGHSMGGLVARGRLPDETRGRDRSHNPGRAYRSADRHYHAGGRCPRGRRWKGREQCPDPGPDDHSPDRHQHHDERT